MADRKTLAFWRSFAMFESLGDAALADLAAAAQRQDWPAGSLLFQRGDPGDYLVALASGRVRLSLGTAQGRELVLRHAEAGTLLGEMAVVDDAPRSADAMAVQATTGHVLTRRDLRALADRHPSLMEGVARHLSQRLRDTTDQMEGIALYPLTPRLARFLLLTLRQIHGTEIPDEARLQLDLSQSEIADILGASRPKVNRALQELRDAGAIRTEGACLTCDPQSLQKFSEPDSE